MRRGERLDFTGQVAIITGAGRGLGREHAHLFASRGCKVLINDLGAAYDGNGNADAKVADEVVKEIKAKGGEATANYDSVQDGDLIVASALEAYGRVDIVVNNAGILTPEVWSDLTLESWQRTINVNLTGVFCVMRAVWPIFVDKKYGRSIMTCSPAIHGAGVAAYAASKAGLIGLANSLQFEAFKLKLDIKSNILIPQAVTRMTEDFAVSVNQRRKEQGRAKAPDTPKELIDRLSPDKVSPIVAWLAHPSCKAEANIYEAGGGYFARLNWARSRPLFAVDREDSVRPPTPEDIIDSREVLSDFENGDMPTSGDGTMGGPSAYERVFRHIKSDLTQG